MVRESLLYLLYELFSRRVVVLGRSVFQKLMFLVEFFDPVTEFIVPSSLTGYQFVVWVTGPVSWGLDEDIELLVDGGFLDEKVYSKDSYRVIDGIDLSFYEDDGHPGVIYKYRRGKKWKRLHVINTIDRYVYDRVKWVAEKYGSMNPLELRRTVNDLIELSINDIREYVNRPIEEVILSSKKHPRNRDS